MYIPSQAESTASHSDIVDAAAGGESTVAQDWSTTIDTNNLAAKPSLVGGAGIALVEMPGSRTRGASTTDWSDDLNVETLQRPASTRAFSISEQGAARGFI